MNKHFICLLFICFSMSNTLASKVEKKVERNLFDSLVMGNSLSGVYHICNSDQKCVISLSQIYCSINLKKKKLSKEGNCTYKNKLGKLGVIYNENAVKLAQQLIVYGKDFTNNGKELKISVKSAVCAGQKNKKGKFIKNCQVQK